MIRCFDILIGCNSALIRITLQPDPDPVKIMNEWRKTCNARSFCDDLAGSKVSGSG